MKKVQKKNKTNYKKSLLVFATIVLLSAGTVYFVNRNPSLATDTTASQLPVGNDTSDYINLQPATEQDNIDVDNTKIELTKDNDQKENTNVPSNTATIIITYSGQSNGFVEVSSYVQNIFEDGGECSLYLTKDTETYTIKSSGITDAKYTLCPTFRVPEGELSSGKWSGVVSYTSEKNKGSSETFYLEVNK